MFRRHVILFELSYKLLAAAVIYPLLFFLVNIGMKLAGISYLTNEYILRTIVSPYIIGIIIVIAVAVVFYCTYELSFILSSYEYKRKNARVTFYANVVIAFYKLKDCIKPANILIMLYYIFSIIAVNVAVLCNLIFIQTTRNLFKIHILNGHWYILAGLIAALIVVYTFVFLGIYSFHMFFLEDKSSKQAYKESMKMVLKNPVRTIGSIVLYNVVILGLIGIMYGLISVILVVGVKLLDMAYMGSAVYLSLLRSVRYIIKVFLCCVAVPLAFLVITRNYYKIRNCDKIDLPLIYVKERNKKFHRLAYLLIVTFSIISVLVNVIETFNNNPFEKIAIFHETQITAHRGASLDAPENTMAAFKKAIEEMADTIELDVQLTLDNELVIMHDETALRTTGVDKRISSMTLAEVKKLDAGSWFSDEYAGERVPTLQEVLELCEGKAKVNIEIKANSNGLAVARKVAEIVKEKEAQNWCVVTSFDHTALQKVKECNKDIRVGYILSVAYGSFYEMDDVDFFSINASFLTKRTVDAIHNAGKEVYAWTVNSEDAIRNLTNKGVDSIITDNTILAIETVYSRDTSETVLNMLKYVFNQ